MFRLWAKLWKDSHLLQDMTVENPDQTLNRTRKIFSAIDEVCHEWDLGTPIWLPNLIRDFQKHDKVRFRQDAFVEEIAFDYLEIQVIEEDDE